MVIASGVAAVIVWLLYFVDRNAWPGLFGAVLQSAVLVLNVAVSRRFPALKVAVVRALQKWLVNPVTGGLLRVGINPLGLMLLETVGRRSGRPRVVPVGSGRRGDVIWVVAEHGERAQYVRNIRRNPRVRVRLRDGFRFRWLSARAQVLVQDDVWQRQRMIAGANPLRWLNVLMVRLLGDELITVRIELDGSSVSADRGADPDKVGVWR